jgi:hypothetical protein
MGLMKIIIELVCREQEKTTGPESGPGCAIQRSPESSITKGLGAYFKP